MASKQRKVLNLVPGEEFDVDIVGGPHEWDLWLSFRDNIKFEPTFSLDKTITAQGAPGFFTSRLVAVITGLKRPACYSPTDILIEGYFRTDQTSVKIRFNGTYNTQVRKGALILNLWMR